MCAPRRAQARLGYADMRRKTARKRAQGPRTSDLGPGSPVSSGAPMRGYARQCEVGSDRERWLGGPCGRFLVAFGRFGWIWLSFPVYRRAPDLTESLVLLWELGAHAGALQGWAEPGAPARELGPSVLVAPAPVACIIKAP